MSNYKEKLNLLNEYAEIVVGSRQRFGQSNLLGNNDSERIENLIFLLRFVYIDIFNIPYDRAVIDIQLLKDVKLYWAVTYVTKELHCENKIKRLMDAVYEVNRR